MQGKGSDNMAAELKPSARDVCLDIRPVPGDSQRSFATGDSGPAASQTGQQQRLAQQELALRQLLELASQGAMERTQNL